jgi:demethylmenaquinone methyltransferase/2-methoxy-6-polyprenyl-1,4-benzoquinol methylase
LHRGDVVLDVACGTGDLCRDLTAAGYGAVGADLSGGMLASARTVAPLIQADALRLPFPTASLDGITSGFALRNFVDLGTFFDEAARVLRPGGRVSLLDVAEPKRAVLRLGHSLYFGKVVPRIGGLLSDSAAYRYLPRSVAYLPAVPEMLDRLRGARFTEVERRLLSGGITQLITATRRTS